MGIGSGVGMFILSQVYRQQIVQGLFNWKQMKRGSPDRYASSGIYGRPSRHDMNYILTNTVPLLYDCGNTRMFSTVVIYLMVVYVEVQESRYLLPMQL